MRILRGLGKKPLTFGQIGIMDLGSPADQSVIPSVKIAIILLWGLALLSMVADFIIRVLEVFN